MSEDGPEHTEHTEHTETKERTLVSTDQDQDQAHRVVVEFLRRANLRSDSRWKARLRPARSSAVPIHPQICSVSRSTTGMSKTPVIAISSATARQVSSE